MNHALYYFQRVPHGSEQSRFTFLKYRDPTGHSVRFQADVKCRMLRGIQVIRRDHPEWVIGLDMTFSGVVTSFSVQPKSLVSTAEALEPLGGVTHRLLRDLRLGEIAAEARRYALSEIDAVHAAEKEPRRQREDRHVRALMASPVRPGRRGRPDVEYARLAAAYVERLGEPKPIKSLKEDTGYSESQLRNLLHEARRRKLLTATPRGRPGGELTPKAQRLLKEARP